MNNPFKMSNMTVDYKVFMSKEGSNDKPEIRRFGIDLDVASNFMYLREKLQSIYPSIRGKHFTVSWKDAENDEITIGSNEELQLSLAETIDKPVRKLYVTLHSDSINERQERQTSNFETSSEPRIRHAGVICDSCERGICGFRYKCLQCPDYDLCSDCEGNGLHPQHCMIRINIPLEWRSHYGKRLSHHINKFMRKAASTSFSEKNTSENEATECPFKNKNFTDMHNSCNQAQSWLDIFSTYLNDWANLPYENSPKDVDAGKSANSKQSQNANNENTAQIDDKAPAEILKNIGESIVQFLDPLGIEVNVQVKNDKTEVKTNIPAENSKQQVSKNSSPIKTVPDDKQSNPTNSPTQKESIPVLDNSINLQNDSKSEISIGSKTSKADEWTLLDTDGIPSSNSSPELVETSDKHVSQEQNSKVENASNSLPKKSMYPSMPNVSDNIWHSNPKIQRAVEVMMQMGFSNENGWLTALLVSKDGDIAKALDVLLAK